MAQWSEVHYVHIQEHSPPEFYTVRLSSLKLPANLAEIVILIENNIVSY